MEGTYVLQTTAVKSHILIIEDVEETRDGLEILLTADGYHVEAARNEADAITRAINQSPDLVLISMDGDPAAVVQSSLRIRERASLNEKVPFVVFCIESVAPGEEVEVSDHVYLTRLDNFNQLRTFIRSLLTQK